MIHLYWDDKIVGKFKTQKAAFKKAHEYAKKDSRPLCLVDFDILDTKNPCNLELNKQFEKQWSEYIMSTPI
jgi:hypothetical protein